MNKTRIIFIDHLINLEYIRIKDLQLIQFRTQTLQQKSWNIRIFLENFFQGKLAFSLFKEYLDVKSSIDKNPIPCQFQIYHIFKTLSPPASLRPCPFCTKPTPWLRKCNKNVRQKLSFGVEVVLSNTDQGLCQLILIIESNRHSVPSKNTIRISNKNPKPLCKIVL